MNRAFNATSDLSVFIAEWRRQIREVLRRVRLSQLRQNYTVRKRPSPGSRAAAPHLQQSHLFIVFVLILLVLVGSVLGFLMNAYHVD
jgi:hypothetical protein